VAPMNKVDACTPTVTCPAGCTLAGAKQCICDAGGPAPCPPGTKECASLGGR
jgi:hypothetical protein